VKWMKKVKKKFEGVQGLVKEYLFIRYLNSLLDWQETILFGSLFQREMTLKKVLRSLLLLPPALPPPSLPHVSLLKSCC